MQRKIRLSPEDKTRINEYAWYMRTDVSKLVREKVVLYGQGKLPSALYPRVGGMTTEISFLVNIEEWDAAIERARASGVDLAGIIRHALLEDAAIARA